MHHFRFRDFLGRKAEATKLLPDNVVPRAGRPQKKSDTDEEHRADQDQSLDAINAIDKTTPQERTEALQTPEKAQGNQVQQVPAGDVNGPERGREDHEQDDGREELADAEEAARDEQAMLESASVEQTYETTLCDYVQAKQDQAEKIESVLETKVSQAQQQAAAQGKEKPGLFTSAAKKKAMATAQEHKQKRLQQLNMRLEQVREIKDGMGLRVPKIEEIATRKMRRDHPEIAASWDSMREAMRKREVKEQRRRKEEQTHSVNIMTARRRKLQQAR